MNALKVLLCAIAFGNVISLAGAVGSEPGSDVLMGDHPLSPLEAGEVLLAELKCASCHQDILLGSLDEKIAPDLSDVGARVSPRYLKSYLADPFSIHPGTSMPDLLVNHTADQKIEISVALTHFLVSKSENSFQTGAIQETESTAAEREEGKALYHSVGCVACHGPREKLDNENGKSADDPEEQLDEDDPALLARRSRITRDFRPVAVNLDHVARKYSVVSLRDFLFDPLKVRKSGRMPEMKLSPSESQAIASYLLQNPEQEEVEFRPDAELAKVGAKYFQELNCAACHPLDGIVAAPKRVKLDHENLDQGCLSEESTTSPRFKLTLSHRSAIRQAIASEEVTPKDRLISQKLASFHCYACHIRDGFGAVPEVYNSYFSGTEKNLGDDGRIPPPLTLVGAKLQPAWMKKVLFDGESIRPYMLTRMPQFGAANLHDLPDLFAGQDVLEGELLSIPNPEQGSDEERALEKVLRAGGRELLGDKGLNCIACHAFNGKPGTVNKGMDLMTTFQRLEPVWYSNFLRNPNAYRPRIVMPSSWADGVAAHKTILDGDTDKQIQAIWYYLSLGTSAADPPGIRVEATKIVVEGEAKTYRGRSRVAGFRGIAIGLPEKISYAFNAETGAMTAIWLDEFISVNWNGQGSGDFNPIGRSSSLPSDVAFLDIKQGVEVWPLKPVMTNQEKTNPNPLYPKNLGYQFRGYYLDERSIPTLMYRSGDVEIEDRSEGVAISDGIGLKRVLTFKTPSSQSLWFRVLTGDLKQEGEDVILREDLKLRLPPVEVLKRPLPDKPEQSELLLRLMLPEGESTFEVYYEPVKQ